LLDDVELIDVLNTTKQTAQDVNEKLLNASETNLKITEACEVGAYTRPLLILPLSRF
jgi:dynein heavy chain